MVYHAGSINTVVIQPLRLPSDQATLPDPAKQRYLPWMKVRCAESCVECDRKQLSLVGDQVIGKGDYINPGPNRWDFEIRMIILTQLLIEILLEPCCLSKDLAY